MKNFVLSRLRFKMACLFILMLNLSAVAQKAKKIRKDPSILVNAGFYSHRIYDTKMYNWLHSNGISAIDGWSNGWGGNLIFKIRSNYTLTFGGSISFRNSPKIENEVLGFSLGRVFKFHDLFIVPQIGIESLMSTISFGGNTPAPFLNYNNKGLPNEIYKNPGLINYHVIVTWASPKPMYRLSFEFGCKFYLISDPWKYGDVYKTTVPDGSSWNPYFSIGYGITNWNSKKNVTTKK